MDRRQPREGQGLARRSLNHSFSHGFAGGGRRPNKKVMRGALGAEREDSLRKLGDGSGVLSFVHFHPAHGSSL
jgi:hypothetical protein